MLRKSKCVLIVDDEESVRLSLRALMESNGYTSHVYSSAKAFLANYCNDWQGCVVVDMHMPEMNGLELQDEMKLRGINLAFIMMTGHGDVPLAVESMKRGAADFVEKPLDCDRLLETIADVFASVDAAQSEDAYARSALQRVETLTRREVEILTHLLAGKQSKVMAYELAISPRTVEVHRARLMEKMQAHTLSDVVRLALAAGVKPADAGVDSGARH